MKCPACLIALQMTDRQGVEIDYCPQCRGVWLDRGELDKIIERFAPPPEKRQKKGYDHDERFNSRWDDEAYEDDRFKDRRRRSFLGELFDFG